MVGLVTASFEGFARELLGQRNAKALPLAVVRHPVGGISRAAAEERITDDVIAAVDRGPAEGRWRMSATETAPPAEQLELEIDGDEAAALERFHAWGFTDGLPVVIPTRERVARMCAGAKHYPLESLGNLAPREGAATIQKIAINAVMAGCLPEHMPVLEAAITAILAPEFNLFGMQTTTHPCALLCIVQGPDRCAAGPQLGARLHGAGHARQR